MIVSQFIQKFFNTGVGWRYKQLLGLPLLYKEETP
jgi:hypothetical protein